MSIYSTIVLIAVSLQTNPTLWMDASSQAMQFVTKTADENANWLVHDGDDAVVSNALYDGTPGSLLLASTLVANGQFDEATLEVAAQKLSKVDPLEGGVGLYTGGAGRGCVLLALSNQLQSGELRTAAKKTFDAIVQTLPMDAWDIDIISGAAGTGTALLEAYREFGDETYLLAAIQLGDQLLLQGSEQDGGIAWVLDGEKFGTSWKSREYPNFSHGATGIGTFLALLYGETGEDKFLEGAIGAAKRIEALSPNWQEDGFAACHHLPGGEALDYVSWCHGPAGSARLFEALYQVTGYAKWREMVLACAKAAVQFANSGIENEKGYWNHGACCGSAGIGEFLLDVSDTTGDQSWKEAAVELGKTILSDPATDGKYGLSCSQAENRVDPEDVKRHTGWAQGSAGLGLFLAHLASTNNAPSLPDNPFRIDTIHSKLLAVAMPKILVMEVGEHANSGILLSISL